MRSLVFVLCLLPFAVSAETVRLSWNYNPDDPRLKLANCTTDPKCFGYTIYWGLTKQSVTTRLRSWHNNSYTFDSAKLGVTTPDTQVCFTLRAYNSEGKSGSTGAVCLNINAKIKPVIPSGLNVEIL